MEKLATNDRFIALINAAVDGIFLINQKGIIELANQAVEKMLGYSQEELIKQNIKFLMPSPHQENHDAYLKNYLETGKGSIIGVGREVEALKKDGSLLQIYLSVGRHETDSGVKFIGIIRDLSELKLNEQNLKKAEHEIHDLVSRLAQVSRVSVMGEMAASLAHEINQPLTAISNYSQACKRLLEVDEIQIDEVKNILEKINKQSLRGANIIKSLRTWVSDQEGVRSEADCNQLIAEVLDIANIEAHQKGIELSFTVEGSVHNIICDPIQIQQVALNLIKNAMDSFSSHSFKADNSKPEVHVKTEYIGNGRLQVSVADNGPGIPKDHAINIFEPFYSTKETGMGMGLSICMTIIQAHGGELDFKSKVDQGTTFFFTLPTSVEANENGA